MQRPRLASSGYHNWYKADGWLTGRLCAQVPSHCWLLPPSLPCWSGFPPFPSFYAKWDLAHALVAANRLPLLALILIGTLIEAGYMFRWFGYGLKRDTEHVFSMIKPTSYAILAALILGWVLGYMWGWLSGHTNLLTLIPVLFALVFIPLDYLAARTKNIIAIAGLIAWFALRSSSYDPIQMIFAGVMLVGGAVILLASFNETGRRMGFYPSAMLMYAGLALLVEAPTSFDFFAAWEILTIGSYFLILRGKIIRAPCAQLYPLLSWRSLYHPVWLRVGIRRSSAFHHRRPVDALRRACTMGVRSSRHRLHDQDRLDGLPYLVARRSCRS